MKFMEKKELKKKSPNYKIVNELWDIFTWPNIHLIGIFKEEKRNNGVQEKKQKKKWPQTFQI